MLINVDINFLNVEERKNVDKSSQKTSVNVE